MEFRTTTAATNSSVGSHQTTNAGVDTGDMDTFTVSSSHAHASSAATNVDMDAMVIENAVVCLVDFHRAAFTKLRTLIVDPLPLCQDARRYVECWKALVWQAKGIETLLTTLGSLVEDAEADLAALTTVTQHTCPAAVDAFRASATTPNGTPIIPRQFFTDVYEIVAILCSAWPRSTDVHLAARLAPLEYMNTAVKGFIVQQGVSSLSNPDGGINQLLQDRGFDFQRATMSAEARKVCELMDKRADITAYRCGATLSDIAQREKAVADRNAAIREYLGANVDAVLPTATAAAAAAANAAVVGGAQAVLAASSLNRPAGAPENCGPDLKLCEEGPRFDFPYVIHGGFTIFSAVCTLLRLADVFSGVMALRSDAPTPARKRLKAWDTATVWEVYTWIAAVPRVWNKTSLFNAADYLETVCAVCRRLHVLSTQLLSHETVSPKSTRRTLLLLFGVLDRVDEAKAPGAFTLTNSAIQGLGAVLVDVLRDTLGTHILFNICGPRAAPPEVARAPSSIESISRYVLAHARGTRAGELNVYASRLGYQGWLRPGACEVMSQRYESTKFTPNNRSPPLTRSQCHKIIMFTRRADAQFMDTIQGSTPTTNILAALAAYPEIGATLAPVFTGAVDTMSTEKWRTSPFTSVMEAPPLPAAVKRQKPPTSMMAAAVDKDKDKDKDKEATSTTPPGPAATVTPYITRAMEENPWMAVAYPVFSFFSRMRIEVGIDCSTCIISRQELLGWYLDNAGPFNPRASLATTYAPPIIVCIGGPVLAVVFRGHIWTVTANAFVVIHTWCTLVLKDLGGDLRGSEGHTKNATLFLTRLLGLTPKPTAAPSLRRAVGANVDVDSASPIVCTMAAVKRRQLGVLSRAVRTVAEQTTATGRRLTNPRTVPLIDALFAPALTGSTATIADTVLATNAYMKANTVMPDASTTFLTEATPRKRHRAAGPPLAGGPSLM